MNKLLFCCPLCGAPLADTGSALRCTRGHSFDKAKEGYTHLLPAQRMHTKVPGDSREMVAARRAFLQSGAYAPFAEALCALAAQECAASAAPILVDAGCGEGYYTARVAAAVPCARVAAFDISKCAVRAAAKTHAERVEWAVASSFAMPLPAASADVLVDVFSPVAQAEFARVVRPGGALILAVPGPRHLFGLKQVLYEKPYENKRQDTAYPGFALERRVPVACSAEVLGENIYNLFTMTPYFWKTPQSGAEALRSLARLQTELEFDFVVYRRAT